MKVSFETKGDLKNLNKWLDNVVNSSPDKTLSKIGEDGIKALSSNTPKDTGETAGGWQYDVVTKGSVSEVSWVNTAHPDKRVNIAKIIDQGYATGTGGYVQPRPYIKKSMDAVFDTAGDAIAKELTKQ